MNYDDLRNAAAAAESALRAVLHNHFEDVEALEGRQYRALQDDGRYSPETFLEKGDAEELYYAVGILGRLSYYIKELIPEPEPEEPTGSWEHTPTDKFSI